MLDSATDQPISPPRRGFIDTLEETIIALLMGMMTLITFANVVARYVFNSNILWALETTVFLFAWMVLLGVSYCIKHTLHLGVDILIVAVNPGLRKVLTWLCWLACMAFALLMTKGAWDYWAPFVGRRAFLETDDIPIADALQFLAHWLNEGEQYEKLPRFVPYFVLPLSMLLLVWRLLQVGWQIHLGNCTRLIAGHEVEDQLDDSSGGTANKTANSSGNNSGNSLGKDSGEAR